MIRLQAMRTFLVSAVALSAFGAFAATWTGKGFDDSWQDPSNWDGDVPGDVDDLSRDLISYVGTISNYRADGWTFDLGANFSRPKVTHDASAKLISFSCRRRRGLKLLVR